MRVWFLTVVARCVVDPWPLLRTQTVLTSALTCVTRDPATPAQPSSASHVTAEPLSRESSARWRWCVRTPVTNHCPVVTTTVPTHVTLETVLLVS